MLKPEFDKEKASPEGPEMLGYPTVPLGGFLGFAGQ
jgi:hypothetical protein